MMRQGPRAKSGKKVKRNSSSSALGEKDENRKLTAKSRPSVEKAEREDPARRKKFPASRKSKTVDKTKGLLNASTSEKTEDSSLLSSQGRRHSPRAWPNKTLLTDVMGINQDRIGMSSKIQTMVNPPMKLNVSRPRVDTGMGTLYPRPNYGAQNPGIRRFNRVSSPPINKTIPRKDEDAIRKSKGDPFGYELGTVETSKKIDTLVTALASLMPPCRSKSQLDMVVGSFANALKEKVSIAGQERRDKNKAFPTSELGGLEIQRGVQRGYRSPLGSTVMNPTEAWVARCKGNGINARRMPQVSTAGLTRGGTLISRVAVPETPTVARKYGSTKIQDTDSEEEQVKHEINYEIKPSAKVRDKEDVGWESRVRRT